MLLISLANMDYVVKEEEGWGWAGGAGTSASMLMKDDYAAAMEKEQWD